MPQLFYKYRAFNTFTLRMLSEADSFYARPECFNDPLDCSPLIEIDLQVEQLERILIRFLSEQYSREKAENCIRRIEYDSTQFGDRETKQAAADFYRDSLASELQRAVFQYFSEWGVFCLSENPLCPLMWSHYADEHRGICIAFDGEDHSFFNLREVQYSSSRIIPLSALGKWIFNREDSNSFEIVLQAMFQAKSPQWSYEKEWRDIYDRNGVQHSRANISSILFGMRCDSAVITHVVKTISKALPEVSFFQISANDFELIKVPVDICEIFATGVSSSCVSYFSNLDAE